MEALQQPIKFNPLNEMRRLLTEIEQHPELLPYLQDGISKLLRDIKTAMKEKGQKTHSIETIEGSLQKAAKEKIDRKIKKIIHDTQESVEELMELDEKAERKNQVHKMRNTLQTLYFGDNRRIILHWETFLELLRYEIFQTSGCRKLLEENKTSIDDWKKKHSKIMFIKDQEEAFEVLQEETKTKELAELGSTLEELLEKITRQLTDWETEMKLF